MIQIGAPEAIRTTVFQIWAYYLRRHQIAFFSKGKVALPHVGLVAHKRDREIIYNFKNKPAWKRSRSSGSGITQRSKRRKLTNLINASQTSEYNSVMASQRSLNASSLADLSASDIRSLATSSASSANTIELEFSDVVKRKLLLKMSPEHLKEHARDFNREMKCHSSLTSLTQRENLKYGLNTSTLIVIIMIALDIHECPYNFTDIIRFCREGHLNMSKVEVFLPSNTNPHHVRLTRSDSRLFSLTANVLREKFGHISEFLLTDVRVPNLHQLCERYVEEFALPRDTIILLTRIINYCEPKFQKKNNSEKWHTCFEGRAAAYIIFLLKLLFGVNGETETLISGKCKLYILFPCSFKLSNFQIQLHA